MRGWHKTAAALAVVASGVVGCGEDQSLSADGCAAAWEDLRQTQGENGSLAPEGTATDRRWQEEYAAAQAGEDGGGEPDTCKADVADAEERFSALVDLSTAIRTYDLGDRLKRAEADLRHAEELRDYDPLPRPLVRAFDRLRAAAPEVAAAVAEVEADAADVDLDDRGEVGDLVERIRRAGESSPSYDEGKRALEVIGRYELSEE